MRSVARNRRSQRLSSLSHDVSSPTHRDQMEDHGSRNRHVEDLDVKESRDNSHPSLDGDVSMAVTSRRSRRRSLAVDHTKPLMIIRPGDDIQSRLDLSSKELQEFNLLLSTDDCEHHSLSVENPASSLLRKEKTTHNNDVVLTPGVVASGQSSASLPTILCLSADYISHIVTNKAGKSSTKTIVKKSNRSGIETLFTSNRCTPLSATIPSSSAYLQYDVDSDDEGFIKKLSLSSVSEGSCPNSPNKKKNRNKSLLKGARATTVPIDTRCFENMIEVEVLERELELAKTFLREKVRAELQLNITQCLIEDGNKSLSHLKTFLESSDGAVSGKRALKRAYEEISCESSKRSRSASTRGEWAAVTGGAPSTTTDRLYFPDPSLCHIMSCITTGPRKMNKLSAINECSNGVTSLQFDFKDGNDADKIAPYLTEDNLRRMVPEDHAVPLLQDVLGRLNSVRVENAPVKSSTCSRNESSINTDKHGATDPLLSASTTRWVAIRVYNYWVSKRAARLNSLLRCYHTFMVNEYQQEVSMPPLPEDFRYNELVYGHDQLVRLRCHLDKARLILEKIRRREKIKRELVKITGDRFDRIFSAADTPQVSSQRKYGKESLQENNACTHLKCPIDASLALKHIRFSLLAQDDGIHHCDEIVPKDMGIDHALVAEQLPGQKPLPKGWKYEIVPLEEKQGGKMDSLEIRGRKLRSTRERKLHTLESGNLNSHSSVKSKSGINLCDEHPAQEKVNDDRYCHNSIKKGSSSQCEDMQSEVYSDCLSDDIETDSLDEGSVYEADSDDYSEDGDIDEVGTTSSMWNRKGNRVVSDAKFSEVIRENRKHSAKRNFERSTELGRKSRGMRNNSVEATAVTTQKRKNIDNYPHVEKRLRHDDVNNSASSSSAEPSGVDKESSVSSNPDLQHRSVKQSRFPNSLCSLAAISNIYTRLTEGSISN
eukprot:CAMPEP_0185043232 /NCGR_PEP_ID=MMETSP1103-20130426/42786_1 /TAXON_ID=36769 /ORGANISM="Paraphysomonas bandaiensis, Strain Caron Lab Isolate" /LENGTH=940 /DNA_ID=CAMNT_0027583383 /DNA_START=189 /DNA_END=3012 /DNA_ORIENTATION=+